MKAKQLYEIRLEDYTFPRYASAIKSYYGTREDIDRLINHLNNNPNTCVRYRETIEAVESYDGTNVPVHNVAGQILPILTPVQEVSRFETQLTDQHWFYLAHGDKVYPCKADTLDICQILVHTDSDYVRCLRAQASNLRICYQGLGWIHPNALIKGFPGIITLRDKQHTMNLFAPLQHYTPDQLTQATADLTGNSMMDLAMFSAEMVGLG